MIYYSLNSGPFLVTLLMTIHFIAARETTEDVLQNLQSDPKILLKWFGSNQIITKPGKF